jgi:hypothetical protein
LTERRKKEDENFRGGGIERERDGEEKYERRSSVDE